MAFPPPILNFPFPSLRRTQNVTKTRNTRPSKVTSIRTKAFSYELVISLEEGSGAGLGGCVAAEEPRSIGSATCSLACGWESSDDGCLSSQQAIDAVARK